MIDPLAAPWTARRNLDTDVALETDLDLEADDEDASGQERDGAASTSYLDAKPPHLAKPPRTDRRLPDRKPRRVLAVVLLALLVATALALTSVIVILVRGGLNWSSGAGAAASPLLEPAPGMADGLPRLDGPVYNPLIQQLIARFTRRFGVAAGSYTGQPAALYREPGTVDLSTNEAGWVMYLGHNSATDLGAPDVTIRRVMAALTESTSPSSFWKTEAGPLGGSAACAITPFGTTTVSVCAWATEYTIGALMSPMTDTRGNELAALMPVMRLDLQPGLPSRRLRPSVG